MQAGCKNFFVTRVGYRRMCSTPDMDQGLERHRHNEHRDDSRISTSQKDNRWIVQYIAVHAISVDTGTTMRRRYQARLAQCHPTHMKAAPITASCPASTPML